MYAIGSLLPLSNSNTGRNLCLSPNPVERKIEKTEAESVEDITAASSIDSIRVRFGQFGMYPEM